MTAAQPAVDKANLDRAAAIRLLVLDVDGVLTDGRLYYGSDGEFMKAFHVHDGFGLKQLMRAGTAVAIISGRRSAAAAHRLRELGIDEVHLGVRDKGALLQQIATRLGLGRAEIAVLGDDQPDLPMLGLAGFAVAVANAHRSVIESAHWVTSKGGGEGAVRELCDLLLEAGDQH